MTRPDQNIPRKPYFSRRGETLDDFVDHILGGSVIVLSEVASGTDTVLNAGIEAVRKRAQETQSFPQISHQVYGIMPSQIDPDTIKLIADAIQDAFRATPSSQPSLRIPVFTIEAVNGQLTTAQETLLQLIYYNTRTGPEVKFARNTDSPLVISPIIQVLNQDFNDKIFKKIKAKLTAGKDTDEKGPEVLNFDIRTFDKEHLLAILQPEFPDEDLTANPDFESLLVDYEGNARTALFLRSYVRKGTLDLISGNIELLDKDPETGVIEGKMKYRAMGPRPTFSEVFRALVSPKCDAERSAAGEQLGSQRPDGQGMQLS